MSKVTKAILMLNILDNKRKWKIKELSEKLEVSERMVRTYKNCLEEAGFNIVSIKGKNGGYVLSTSRLGDYLNLTDEDINKLSEMSTSEEISTIIDKLKSNYYSEKNKYFSVLNKTNKKYNDKEKDIIEAIINNNKLKIVYKGSSEKITIRVITPIDIFYYDNEVYLLAFCELRGSIRNFDFNKIQSYSVL